MSSAEISVTMIPQPAPAMAWQSIDGQMVLLDSDGMRLIGISDTGARIWALMDGARSLDDIAHALTEEFDVSLDAARADVRAFVTELAALGAVVL